MAKKECRLSSFYENNVYKIQYYQLQCQYPHKSSDNNILFLIIFVFFWFDLYLKK